MFLGTLLILSPALDILDPIYFPTLILFMSKASREAVASYAFGGASGSSEVCIWTAVLSLFGSV